MYLISDRGLSALAGFIYWTVIWGAALLPVGLPAIWLASPRSPAAGVRTWWRGKLIWRAGQP